MLHIDDGLFEGGLGWTACGGFGCIQFFSDDSGVHVRSKGWHRERCKVNNKLKLVTSGAKRVWALSAGGQADDGGYAPPPLLSSSEPLSSIP